MEIDWSEHYVKKGDPAAPTYYIIRRANTSVGLFSNYVIFAGHIRYALSHGYIPVIDMQNYPNNYLPPELLGKENAWEYYFEQPLRVDLKHAYEGENVILGTGDHPADFPGGDHCFRYFNNKDNILTEWRMLVKLGLLKIKPEIQKEIDETWSKFFAPTDRVLGLLLRGTDYVSRRPYQHPIPPYRVCITSRYSKAA